MIPSPCLFLRQGDFFVNPAIVAGVHKGFADEQKANEKSVQNFFVSKAPSGRELAPKATEGEREI